MEITESILCLRCNHGPPADDGLLCEHCQFQDMVELGYYQNYRRLFARAHAAGKKGQSFDQWEDEFVR